MKLFFFGILFIFLSQFYYFDLSAKMPNDVILEFTVVAQRLPEDIVEKIARDADPVLVVVGPNEKLRDIIKLRCGDQPEVYFNVLRERLNASGLAASILEDIISSVYSPVEFEIPRCIRKSKVFTARATVDDRGPWGIWDDQDKKPFEKVVDNLKQGQKETQTVNKELRLSERTRKKLSNNFDYPKYNEVYSKLNPGVDPTKIGESKGVELAFLPPKDFSFTIPSESAKEIEERLRNGSAASSNIRIASLDPRAHVPASFGDPIGPVSVTNSDSELEEKCGPVEEYSVSNPYDINKLIEVFKQNDAVVNFIRKFDSSYSVFRPKVRILIADMGWPTRSISGSGVVRLVENARVSSGSGATLTSAIRLSNTSSARLQRRFVNHGLQVSSHALGGIEFLQHLENGRVPARYKELKFSFFKLLEEVQSNSRLTVELYDESIREAIDDPSYTIVNYSVEFPNINSSSKVLQGIQINDAANRITFVFAAGNSGAEPTYPATVANQAKKNTIVVAASRRNAGLAGFSSYGASLVDLAAPGCHLRVPALSSDGSQSIAIESGTSYSAPLVSFALAVIAIEAGSAKQVINRAHLLTSSDFNAELRGIRHKRLYNIYRSASVFTDKIQIDNEEKNAFVRFYDRNHNPVEKITCENHEFLIKDLRGYQLRRSEKKEYISKSIVYYKKNAQNKVVGTETIDASNCNIRDYYILAYYANFEGGELNIERNPEVISFTSIEGYHAHLVETPIHDRLFGSRSP